jgi:hypothetical protein
MCLNPNGPMTENPGPANRVCPRGKQCSKIAVITNNHKVLRKLQCGLKLVL